MDERVLAAMLPYLRDDYGNASSTHRLGRAARVAVEESREQIAAYLEAHPSEIVFTSGGTEGDNAALDGILAHTHKGLLTSDAEHSAILSAGRALEVTGHPLIRLRPDSSGCITAQQIAESLTPEIGLVSVALVNNEIGAVAPIREISVVCRTARVPLHTDAVQAAGVMTLGVDDLGVDLMTLSAHKIYGPKGIGVLYVRSGLDFKPLLVGGAQERRRRGGTENVAAIVGMAKAFELVTARMEREARRLMELRKAMERELTATLGDTFVYNTPIDGEAAPHILSIAMKPVDGSPIDGEILLLNMDLEGVLVSADAACSSGAVQISHVLQAIGVEEATASAAIRFSMGRDTTPEEVHTAVHSLARIVHRMRARQAA